MSSGNGVLLVFPPLSTLVTHPELGMPQLHAGLAARGIDSRQIDLNAELVYRHLRQREVIRECASLLDEARRPCLGAIVGELEARRTELSARLSGLGAGPPGDAEREVQRHLDESETLLPRRFELCLGGAEPQLEALVDAMSHGPGAWVTGARVVQLLQRALIEPLDYSPAAVQAAVARPCPLLDGFYASSLDPHLADEPLLVGLSLHGTQQLVAGLKLAARVKAAWPRTRVVAGGPWCIAAQDLIATRPGVLFEHVDAFAIGEGDRALVELCEALGGGSDGRSVAGLLWRDGGDAQLAAELPLEQLPAPRFDGLPFDLYPEQVVPFRTLRGCYWARCRFCYHLGPADLARPPSPRPRRMPAALLAKLVQTLERARAEHGIRRWTTADNATPPGHLLQVARALEQAGLETQWRALARFDRELTPELCREIRRSGCSELQLGLETSSPAGWKRLGKGIDRATVLGNLRACRDAGIERVVFVLDDPGQAPGELRDTLAFVCDHHDLVDRFVPLRFELGRNSRAFLDPSALGLELLPESHASLDVFNLPFQAHQWLGRDEHRALWDEHALRLAHLQASRSPSGARVLDRSSS